MAENIKVGDFIELDYTAKIKSKDLVFDTTVESDAKKHKIHNTKIKYKPLIVKVGQGQLVKGLDEFIVDKSPGNYTVEIEPEKAFGKKDAKLLRLISIKEFHKNQIQPMPGLEVELDGYRGIVRTVNGGRVIVDFNHPLSSQDITYDISIKGFVTDPKLKIETALESFRLPFEKVEMNEGKAIVTFKAKIPDEVSKPVIDELKKFTGIEDIEFK
ncbi:MAG: FKBP-type peptidyl-prolyl cis-trans isomerase [Candidatus Woesearchaeota archaeon]